MSVEADLAATTALGTVLLSGFAMAPTLVPSRQPVERESRRTPRSVSTSRSVAILGTTLATTLVIVLVGLVPAIALVIALWARRQVADLLTRRRARERLTIDLPDAVDMLVLTAQAGLSPHQAIRDLARSAPRSLRPAFAAVVHELERGRPLADAIEVLRREIGVAAHPLVDTLAAAERYGAPLAPVLDRLAIDARHARRRRDEANARRLPVRLAFPLVLCTLPGFVLIAVAPSVLAALSSLGATSL